MIRSLLIAFLTGMLLVYCGMLLQRDWSKQPMHKMWDTSRGR